ncbi:hypothetical protein NU09_2407 [Flavobacterium beibuense]|uniref:Uncharacterized protein n=1 Tax=Flavobacterium beibuense TaxID=657326 RepID=A0A444W888_9FLAO|nr:hypothetical protein NU09_2407 [Flavobacterium beibuense]
MFLKKAETPHTADLTIFELFKKLNFIIFKSLHKQYSKK